MYQAVHQNIRPQDKTRLHPTLMRSDAEPRAMPRNPITLFTDINVDATYTGVDELFIARRSYCPLIYDNGTYKINFINQIILSVNNLNDIIYLCFSLMSVFMKHSKVFTVKYYQKTIQRKADQYSSKSSLRNFFIAITVLRAISIHKLSYER